MLEVFIEAYKRKNEITEEQINLDEFHYLILMFRQINTESRQYVLLS